MQIANGCNRRREDNQQSGFSTMKLCPCCSLDANLHINSMWD